MDLNFDRASIATQCTVWSTFLQGLVTLAFRRHLRTFSCYFAFSEPIVVDRNRKCHTPDSVPTPSTLSVEEFYTDSVLDFPLTMGTGTDFDDFWESHRGI